MTKFVALHHIVIYLILDSPFPRWMADLPAGCEHWLPFHFPFSQSCIRNLNNVDPLSCNTWKECKSTALKFSAFERWTVGEDGSVNRMPACSRRINTNLNPPILCKTGGACMDLYSHLCLYHKMAGRDERSSKGQQVEGESQPLWFLSEHHHACPATHLYSPKI